MLQGRLSHLIAAIECYYIKLLCVWFEFLTLQDVININMYTIVFTLFMKFYKRYNHTFLIVD